jgi:stringent starvation protein B
MNKGPIIAVGMLLAVIVAIVAVLMIRANGQHVVIVSGYGAPVEGNPGYEEYIQMVYEFVNNKDNDVDAVVFNGGYTVLEDQTEAELMVSYYNTLDSVEKPATPAVYEQGCSVTAWQSIANAKQILAENDVVLTDISQVTMVGDMKSEREFTLWAEYQFNELETNDAEIAFEGFDHGSPEKDDRPVEEVLAVYKYENVADQQLQERLDTLAEAFGYDVQGNLVAKGCEQFAGYDAYEQEDEKEPKDDSKDEESAEEKGSTDQE